MQQLKFPENFFEGEDIEGFYVEPLMKRTWAAQLRVLAHVDEICKRNDIKYFATFGTLLGTIRHGGFIPWDDDIDIGMLREDYMKFLKVARQELPPYYKISNCYFEESHNQPITAIMNRKVVWQDKELTSNYYGCPFIVGIDIFSYNYIPKDRQLADVLKTLYCAAYDLAQNYKEYKISGEADGLLEQLEQVSGTSVDRSRNIRNELWRLADRILMMFARDECDMVTYPSAMVRAENEDRRLKIELFENLEEREITGGFKIPVPKGYDEILTKYYGNYMNPVVGNMAHDYPFYKRQIEYLKSKGIKIENK